MNKHPVNVKQTKPHKESVHVDLIENGMNKRPCSDSTLSRMKKRLKCKSESDITFDINTMNSHSQVENEDIPQKGWKRKREKSYPFSCSLCKATFCTVNSLLQHKNECESNQMKKEDQKSEIITKNNRHLITQFNLSKNVHFDIIKTGVGVVRCILCGNDNDCFEDFSYHAKSKHFPYQCLVCPAFFSNMVDLCQHSIACVYIKGQGYRCSVCQKIIHSSKLLRVHCEDYHTVYICFLCNSEFDDQKTLDLHRQTCS
ncbi:putative zinc finger protein 730 [Mytilus trossulus]|uniref:putative zinc finger protein 730 n=1 Tax=Mytilus trossulus TaxID=6551 RepID=UPI003005EAA3